MEDKLTIFKNIELGEFRAIIKEGEPWFVAADVCKVLDIVNNRDAVAKLDEEEKGVALTDTNGGKQEMTIVNESGLYTLVLGSRKPEAKTFKRWITHDIMPSIRKYGMYITPELFEKAILDPAIIADILQQMECKNKLLECEKKLSEFRLDTIKENFKEIVQLSRKAEYLNKMISTPTGEELFKELFYAEYNGKGE